MYRSPERATARRNKAEEVLAKASRDAELAREEVTRLVSEKSRVEQSSFNAVSPSCLQSLSSSFHHVLSDLQSSLAVVENIVAQAKAEMETVFSKLNGLAAAVASASRLNNVTVSVLSVPHSFQRRISPTVSSQG